MKKKILLTLITLLMACITMFSLTACGGNVEFKIKFVVDDQVYATVNTSGSEIIRMPENPTKDDYNFDGWFWDKDVWEKPFTANSLLDAPLSSDMSVYAKFTKIHIHEYVSETTAPTCTEKGYTPAVPRQTAPLRNRCPGSPAPPWAFLHSYRRRCRSPHGPDSPRS